MKGRKERPNKKIWYNKVHQITRESTDISLENFLLEKFFSLCFYVTCNEVKSW